MVVGQIKDFEQEFNEAKNKLYKEKNKLKINKHRPVIIICSDCKRKKPLQAKNRCSSCYDKYLRKKNPEYAKRQDKITKNGWMNIEKKNVL